MNPLKHIRSALQVLFGLLLVCWPAVDTEPTGAVTVSRIVLGGSMLLLSVAAIAIAGFQRQQLEWRLTDWAMLACAVWFIGNVVFVGRGETDPYNLLNGSVVLAAYIFCRLAGSTIVLPAMLISGLVQAGIATAQLCGSVATRHAYYVFTGSFPNPGPLGGWLCVALLAAIGLSVRFLEKRCRIRAALCALGGLYIGVILLRTDSRAAWLGFIAGGVYLCSTFKFPYRRAVFSTLSVLAIVGAWLLYGYKKDSADSRLLIWRVTADMIARKPIAGYGAGTFPEHYMFAQAAYFERHPDSRFARLAEQTSYPFNELIGVTAEQGITGGLLLVVLVGSALLHRGNIHHKTLLIGLAVFGLFSYPSALLSFGLLFAALLADCVNGSRSIPRPISIRTALCLPIAVLGGGTFLLYAIHKDGRAARSRYIRVREASELMRRNDPADLPRLELLAGSLPIAGFYTDLGDLYLEADSVEHAKTYYRTAVRMIPSRLRPYDGLFRTYVYAGQTDSATLMARKIMAMPVKVSNTTTIRIRQTARKWLETHNPNR